MIDAILEQRTKLVEALYRATLAGRVTWTGGDDGIPVYETTVDGIPITINDEERETSGGAARYAILAIYEETGRKMDSFDDMDIYLGESANERSTYSEMLMNLHEVAQRQALGTDSLFRRLIKFLTG